MTEPDSKYWPPDKGFENVAGAREIWRKEGRYPPKLNDVEKDIIDRQGSYDSDGNRHGVTWTLTGRPIANKTDSNGFVYDWDKDKGRYKRYNSSFGIVFL